MKSEDMLLIGGLILAYFYFKSPTATGSPYLYPSVGSTGAKPPTGSGISFGTGGAGTGGSGGGSSSSAIPPSVQSGGVTSGSAVFCPDGTQVNDLSLCPVNTSNYVTCPDGTLVNDPSLCPLGYVDTGDPCDPNSVAYDPTQCGAAVSPADTVDMTAGGL